LDDLVAMGREVEDKHRRIGQPALVIIAIDCRASRSCWSPRHRPPPVAEANPEHSADDCRATIKLRVAARTIPDLWYAVRNALPQVTPNECANYFTAAGYEPE
jgi:hypothetical protein